MQKIGRGSPRARNLSKIFGCVHRTVHWGQESLYEREINQKLSSKIIEFHSTFSRHGNTQASLHCSFGLTKKTVQLWRESLCEREIFQNLFKIKQNRHATRGNYSKLSSKNIQKLNIWCTRRCTEPREQREQCEIAQALPSSVRGEINRIFSPLIKILHYLCSKDCETSVMNK